MYSHVFLDFLNNYGIRLLTPFDWRWFYGDTLFIMDPWLWLTLGVWRVAQPSVEVAEAGARGADDGGALHRRHARLRARRARDRARGVARRARQRVRARLMVGPAPGTPFERQIIVDAGDHYETGAFTWRRSPRSRSTRTRCRRTIVAPKCSRRDRRPLSRSFLVWSRFPFFQLEAEESGTRVSVGDMRFTLTNPVRNALGRGRFTATTVVPSIGGLIPRAAKAAPALPNRVWALQRPAGFEPPLRFSA